MSRASMEHPVRSRAKAMRGTRAMNKTLIDLFSDTVTRPTLEMRQSIINAEVGGKSVQSTDKFVICNLFVIWSLAFVILKANPKTELSVSYLAERTRFSMQE